MELMLEKKVAYVLKNMGIRQELLGYRYAKYAIELILQDESILNAITRRLYPAVAEKFNTTPSRAERAIRHSIESAFDHADPDMIQEIFGNTISIDLGKATNSHFLAVASELVRFIELPDTAYSIQDTFGKFVANNKGGYVNA